MMIEFFNSPVFEITTFSSKETLAAPLVFGKYIGIGIPVAITLEAGISEFVFILALTITKLPILNTLFSTTEIVINSALGLISILLIFKSLYYKVLLYTFPQSL